MNKDVPVAELNFPSVRPGKFTWDLSPAELANTSRKHRSDFPEYHIQLRTKNESTIPLTSTPIINPINTPLPDSGEISWDSDNSLKSNNKPKVIIKQPNSSISPVLVDKISDKLSPSYSDAALAKNVILDLHASSFATNDNINIAAATEPEVIVAPVVQNLPAVEGEDPGVCIDPVIPGPVDIHPTPAVPDPVGGAADWLEGQWLPTETTLTQTGKPKQVNPNLPKMSGSCGPNSSMQDILRCLVRCGRGCI